LHDGDPVPQIFRADRAPIPMSHRAGIAPASTFAMVTSETTADRVSRSSAKAISYRAGATAFDLLGSM
jgi:hypothetical protein